MQLCKCINYFLKAHNKQLNQYCLNFTIFFFYQKKSFKKIVRVGSGQVDLQKTWVGSWVNPFLLRAKKIGFGLGIFWVGSVKVRKF